MNFNVHLIEMAGGKTENDKSSNNLTIENDDEGTESGFVNLNWFHG